jgi:hypothetical protein
VIGQEPPIDPVPGSHFPSPAPRNAPRQRCHLPGLLAAIALAPVAGFAAGPDQAAAAFRHGVEPLLEDYCYDCHGDGSSKGKVAFDELSDADLTRRTDLWFAVLKNLRANIMPPAGKPRPTPEEARRISEWIKYSAFGIRADDPDPGRVTLRRLNRIEYGRTVHSLLGVDYPSEVELPPDDTGNGFDNIGDVLSVSPLLIEKYLQAADTIVTGVVPQTSRIVPVLVATGRDFRDYADGGKDVVIEDGDDASQKFRAAIGKPLGYRESVTATHTFQAPLDAMYRLTLNLEIKGPFNFDPERGLLTVTIDGASRFVEKLGWDYRKELQLSSAETWKAGPHVVRITMAPLPPAPLPAGALPPEFPDPQHNEARIVSLQVQGPFGFASSVEPPGYRRFFPRDVPKAPAERERYAREILGAFATRAFRRPVDEAVLSRLVALERDTEAQPGGNFEQGISRAMMAVLASPRFLFRFEEPEPADTLARFPRVDELSLASRLSYFLWSTMPDDALFAKAERGELRSGLRSEVARMLADPQSSAFTRNFTGQWLQARDVEFVPINKRAVLGLGPAKGPPRIEFDTETRKAMRAETEMVFDYVMKGDRSVLELVDSNYTFLNEKLAQEYGVPGVKGKEMRYVQLPEGSPRGGVITEGTTLSVTSNPTRTSPVKRGQFILQNILGTPVPPPPANVPTLEESKAAFGGREPSLKEMLAVHRKSALCSSCHERMDPLGLALENFNALGEWRTLDAGQQIVPAGGLVSGERFMDVHELKHIITHERRADYYRCLTEKMMTYALGRGLDYGDVEAVDRIVDAMEHDGGRFSTLLLGVIESAPFQKERRAGPANPPANEPSHSLVLTSTP